MMILFFFAGVFVFIIANIGVMFVKQKIEMKLEYDFKKIVLNLKKNIDFYDYKPFTFENQIIFDSGKIVKDYLIAKLDFIFNLILVMAITAVATYLAPIMLPILIGVNILIILINRFLQKKSSLIIKRYSLNRGDYLKKIDDLVKGYDDSFALGQQLKLEKKYIQEHRHYFENNRRLINRNALVNTSKRFLNTISFLISTVLLIFFLDRNYISLPVFIAFFTVNSHFTSHVQKLISNIFSIKANEGLYQKVALSIPDNHWKKLKNLFPVEVSDLKISVKNIAISYPDITINEHDKVLIKGPNGSGKSLLLKSIFGIYNQYQGNIKYGNKTASLLQVSDHLSYLPTNPMILNTSIKENILLAKNGEIKVSFINKYSYLFDALPHLDNNAQKLSHGQKQIVALLRVLIKKPKLIIIDEAISGVAKSLLKIIEADLSKLKCAVLYVNHSHVTCFQGEIYEIKK